MISGGNVTVFVSNMDDAAKFYTEVLGLKLIERYGDDWTTVAAGSSLTIGLHPSSPKFPAPGAIGSMTIGLEVSESIESVVRRLQSKGVQFRGEIVKGTVGSFADFADPDGNPLYLWEVDHSFVSGKEITGSEMQSSQN